MVIIEVHKYSSHTNGYNRQRTEEITLQQAWQMNQFILKMVPVEGFYKYTFTIDGLSFSIFTLHADLVDFITKTKQENNTNGSHTGTDKTTN